MIKLVVKEKVDLPAKDVFKFFKEEMKQYATSLPNITHFEILEEKQLNKNKTYLKILCEGAGKIPKPLRKIITPKMIRWLEFVTFDEEKLEATYYVKTFYFTDVFRCEGKWNIIEKNETVSIVNLDAVLEINVPILGRIVEEVLSKYIYKNIKENIRIAKKLLKEREKRK